MYTLTPTEPGTELCIGYHRTPVSTRSPIICSTDADLVTYARIAPFLLIVELGMTFGEMLAKAHEEAQSEPPPAAEAPTPAPDGHVCPECGRTCKSAYTLGAHMKSHKGGE